MTGPSVPRPLNVTDPLLDAVLDGRYRVVEKLGQGGMGAVYRAEVVPDGGSVAVKVLLDELVSDDQQRERFEREARALFGLEHPHILHVHDFGVVNGLPYLVMELLEGQTLETVIEESPPDPDTALDLARQVLSGLAFAHGQGALHRDIKTENIQVTRGPDGRLHARLLDFGLVKFVDDDRWGEGKALTAFGEVFGSPAYMSPEQCTGAPLDVRSDVYSMGVVLYELLTGAWPYMEESRAGMMRAHLTEPVPSPKEARPELSARPELEGVLKKALAKDRDERFAHAGEMLAALDAVPRPAAWLEGGAAPGPAAPGPAVGGAAMRLPQPAPPRRGVPPWVWYAVIGGGLAVAFLLLVTIVLLLVD